MGCVSNPMVVIHNGGYIFPGSTLGTCRGELLRVCGSRVERMPRSTVYSASRFVPPTALECVCV